jgi:hypothetical protein
MMGKIRMGVDFNLISHLTDSNEFTTFVETGTYKGNTTHKVSKYFDEVHTIEASEIYHSEAKNRFLNNDSITCHFGVSENILEKILNEIDKSSIFWLDAHFSGGDTAGKDNECPLLSELSLLKKRPEVIQNSIIMIDDARLFMAPPPFGHDPRQWPNIRDVISALGQNVIVFEDVIYFFPDKYKSTLVDYFRNKLKINRKFERNLIIKILNKTQRVIEKLFYSR